MTGDLRPVAAASRPVAGAPRGRRLRVQIFAAGADRAFTEHLARALEDEGAALVTGPFDPARTDAVLVVWSLASRTSKALIGAAKAPLDAGALEPVSIDGALPPAGFAHLKPTDLTAWTGEADDPRWRRVWDDIARRVAPAAERLGDLDRDENRPPPAAESAGAGAQPASPLVAAALAGAAVLVIGGFAALLAVGRDRAPGAAPEVAAAVPAPSRTSAIPTGPPPPAPDVLPPTEDRGDEIALANKGAPPSSTTPAQPNPTATPTDAIAALIERVAAGEDAAPADRTPTEQSRSAPAGGAGRTPFRDCPECPEMAALPGGRFQMGWEAPRRPAEGPAVEIELGRFALAVRETTFAEWDACVAAGGCRAHRPEDFGWGRGLQPVVDISWEDAEAYARWLSATTGKRYRLPSEAEWEYAAHGGAATPYAFGTTITTRQANFDGSLSTMRAGRNRGRPVAVGSFPPNAYGLFDLHGNVWEWTADCWNKSHRGRPSDAAARGGDCRRRVLKGGAFNNGAWRLAAEHRLAKNAASREFDQGFRVARNLD